MRPANQQQAERHMEHLMNRKLKGNRGTRVKEHTQRAKKIAAVIWTRFHLTSTVHTHNSLIYKETQKYLGTTNAQIFKDYVNQYSG